jgi:catechol 2,3-dioxygenase-like lactoylglutathione lyase family enzyme
VIDRPDARGLMQFYCQVLGMRVNEDMDGWVAIGAEPGLWQLAFDRVDVWSRRAGQTAERRRRRPAFVSGWFAVAATLASRDEGCPQRRASEPACGRNCRLGSDEPSQQRWARTADRQPTASLSVPRDGDPGRTAQVPPGHFPASRAGSAMPLGLPLGFSSPTRGCSRDNQRGADRRITIRASESGSRRAGLTSTPLAPDHHGHGDEDVSNYQRRPGRLRRRRARQFRH